MTLKTHDGLAVKIPNWMVGTLASLLLASAAGAWKAAAVAVTIEHRLTKIETWIEVRQDGVDASQAARERDARLRAKLDAIPGVSVE